MNEVACPICHGPVWDNRLKKLNPKAPDFKCKDKNCSGVIWHTNGETPTAPNIPAPTQPSPAAIHSFEDAEAQKQLRIARESIFSSLCRLVGNNSKMIEDKSLREISVALVEQADQIINWVYGGKE